MSLAHKILKSSVWVYLTEWFSRLIGFFSTLILARILTPDDFGIVATVLITSSVFHVLSTAGAREYLLRKNNITDAELNTAWSVDILLKILVCTALFLLAENLSNFFDDIRLEQLFKVAAFIPLVQSFSNVGFILFEKEMNYKPNFKLKTITQLIVFFIKIGLALTLKNYWAFIIAELCGAIISLVLSYILHSYRPQFCFSHIKEQWSFSQWMLAKGVFSTLRYKIDNILIAKFFLPTALGVYTVARDVATVPAGQIIGPIMQPLYVGLAKTIDAPKIFADKVQKIILCTAIIIFPISMGTSAIAENLVFILLGDKWKEATLIIEVIALIIFSGAFNDLFSSILTVLGKVKQSFLLDVIIGVLTVVIFILLTPKLSLVEFAILRVTFGFMVSFTNVIFLRQISKISLTRIFLLVFLPFMNALLMYLTVSNISLLIDDNGVIKLLIQLFSGVVVYISLSILMVYTLRNRFKEFDFFWNTFIEAIRLKILATLKTF
jgi:O-antigen/teichoic acid export membrane protein